MPVDRPYIPAAIRRQVEIDADQRCGYCLTPRIFTAKQLHLEHIIPLATGGNSDISNLWLACDLCNSSKGARTHATDPLSNQRVSLYHPRRQRWSEHFMWSEDGIYLIGLTPNGRATVSALKLNQPYLVEARTWWVKAGWHPPRDI